MKIYKKPYLATYQAEDIVDKMGPLQTAYGVQAEIWRTGQLDQQRNREYVIVKFMECPDTEINSKIV